MIVGFENGKMANERKGRKNFERNPVSIGCQLFVELLMNTVGHSANSGNVLPSQSSLTSPALGLRCIDGLIFHFRRLEWTDQVSLLSLCMEQHPPCAS
jgi:hypothetical protein